MDPSTFIHTQKLALAEKRRIMLRRRSPIVIRPRSILKKGNFFFHFSHIALCRDLKLEHSYSGLSIYLELIHIHIGE